MNPEAGMGKNLRVLHVISSMAPEAGGPPVVCAGLAGATAKRGHAVTIVTVSNIGETLVDIPPAVSLLQFRRNGSSRYMRSATLDTWLGEHASDFDIVHLHSLWQFPTFAAARACWKMKVPYVVLLNGMLDRYVVRQRSRWIKTAYWVLREGRIERRARGIHFLNRAEIRRAVPWIHSMPKFIIGNGISHSEIAALPPRGRFRTGQPAIGDRPLALFLSRLHPKKGLERLIPAWKDVAQQRPDVRLAIVGTGDAAYVAKIDALIAEHGLREQVIRIGQLVGESKWQALVDADVFVLPSHQEGFSMAITEALAAGRPAVVTDECNFDELQSIPCGVIVRNGDMRAFVTEVMALLDDAPRRTALGEAGATLVRERFIWEKIAGDLEQVYRWTLAGKKLSPDGSSVWRCPEARSNAGE